MARLHGHGQQYRGPSHTDTLTAVTPGHLPCTAPELPGSWAALVLDRKGGNQKGREKERGHVGGRGAVRRAVP